MDVGPAAGDEEEEEKGEPAPLPQANPLPLRTLLAPHPDQAATGEDGTDDNAGMSMVEMKEIMGEMRRGADGVEAVAPRGATGRA